MKKRMWQHQLNTLQRHVASTRLEYFQLTSLWLKKETFALVKNQISNVFLILEQRIFSMDNGCLTIREYMYVHMRVYFNSNPFLSAKLSKSGGKKWRYIASISVPVTVPGGRMGNETKMRFCCISRAAATGCIPCQQKVYCVWNICTKIPLLTSEWPQVTSALLGWHI